MCGPASRPCSAAKASPRPDPGTHHDKTRPGRPLAGALREKTRPARQKLSVLGYFRRAGRKMSRVLRRHSKRGEFSRADHHTLATQRTPTVQNSPGTRHVRPQPVQNSPSIAKNAHFGPFDASREKIVTVGTQTTRAGRTFSRKPPLTSHAAHTPRYKTLPATPTSRPNRYKTLPHSKKRLFQPIRGEQGENYPGPDTNNPSRENLFPHTTTHQPRWAHSPVQNSPGTQRVRPQPVQNSPRTAQCARPHKIACNSLSPQTHNDSKRWNTND